MTASDVAQQAANSKSEKVLRVAVERAERASHEAKAAERRAAEAAAHSIAHQEVSTSQAEVADQARLISALPQQESACLTCHTQE